MAVDQGLVESPVVLLEGPRSVGKSTLLQDVARQRNAFIFDLDDDDVASLARSNPALIAGESTPVIIDEYQKAPEILDAIKARLNRGSRPGMFLLAGSASFDAQPRGVQALTGRVQRLTVSPLTQCEIDRTSNHLIEHAFAGTVARTAQPSTITRWEYENRVLRGGMPLALAQPGLAARRRWFAGLVRQALERDAGELRRLGRKAALPQLLARTAGQTAQVLNINNISSQLGIAHGTATEYLALLGSLFLIGTLPAWGTTLLSRSTTSPKVHLIDSGVGAHLLRLSSAKLASRSPAALTEFGHLLESFALQEVLRMASWLDTPIESGHWRTRDSQEVDLILERYDGTVVAIELKAAERLTQKDTASLRMLRDRLGSAFAVGIVLYLGSTGYEPEDRIHFLPLERLWRPDPVPAARHLRVG